MDRKQREQFRDIVLAAMEAKAWSAATVAKEAKVSQTTMTKITRAENVTPGTVGKVRRALGIQALARAQAKEGYTTDVELVRDTIGIILRDTPEADRAAKAAAMFAALAAISDTGDTPKG
jgi:ribosome-binding protein aMBF1 (putative translation factor)